MTERDACDELEAVFPRLRTGEYIRTSDYEPDYNCVAFVAEDRTRRWEPPAGNGQYWPPGVPCSDGGLDDYLTCFEQHFGFARCDDGDLEEGVEKIAIYVDADGDFCHVARQLEDGWWSSKLGFFDDISHESLELLLDGRPTPYGDQFIFMARPRRVASPSRTGLILPRG